MIRFFLTAYIIGSLAITGALTALSQPINADAPMITTQVEQRDGATISLKYKAIRWNTLPSSATETIVDTDYLEKVITPWMGVFSTNIKVEAGNQTIDPGEYFFGFERTDETVWTLVVSRDNIQSMRVPLGLKQEPAFVPFLSLVFTPGVTDRDTVLNVLFGNLSASVRWTMQGVPTQLVDPMGLPAQPEPGVSPRRLTESIIPLEDKISVWKLTPPSGSSDAAIDAATSTTTTPLRRGGFSLQSLPLKQVKTPVPPKAGSGSFRYPKSQQEKENR